MGGIQITDLSKWYTEAIPAVMNLNLLVEEGEFLVLLGPSGCGKTTTLRCVTGIETPNSGEIYLGGTCVYSDNQAVDVAPRDRHAGLVFQNYALYPHMTVAKNIAFGLKTRKMPKNLIGQRVKEAIALVGLEGYEDRSPSQLSGGQQQRVAVARMVAAQPEFLLFDEPLSNLDPKLRVSLRVELKRLHRKMEATSIYVTHDQAEAMILADRIAVMQNGTIVQVCDGNRLYHFPETVAIADFTGNPKTNVILGEVAHTEDGLVLLPEDDPYSMLFLDKELREYTGQRIYIHARPEDVEMTKELDEDEGRLNVLAVMPQGADVLVVLEFESCKKQLMAKSQEGFPFDLKVGQPVGVRFRRGNLYSEETGRIIGSFGFESYGYGEVSV